MGDVMTRDTKVIVRVGLIDDYEVKIGKLQEELAEAKASNPTAKRSD